MNEWWNGILENICEALREFLIKDADGLFDQLNETTLTISDNISMSPEEWNGNIFVIIKNLSESIVLPIGGTILAFVISYELIALVLEKNNMNEFDESALFTIILKMMIGASLLKHSFDICVGIFDVANYVIKQTGQYVSDSTALQTSEHFREQIEIITDPLELLSLMMTIKIMKFLLGALVIVINLIIAGRFIEIYLNCSIATIPFATFMNKEWGQIGYNFVRNLLALGFQGFFMMICVAIYYGLIQDINVTNNIALSLTKTMGYAVLLVFALWKTNQISRSVFHAH